LDKKTNNSHLFITLSEGETCLKDKARNYETTVEMICDKNGTPGKLKAEGDSMTVLQCDNHLKIYSIDGKLF
jgi:hypothetical protein